MRIVEAKLILWLLTANFWIAVLCLIIILLYVYFWSSEQNLIEFILCTENIINIGLRYSAKTI